jgi:hypothetical protein
MGHASGVMPPLVSPKNLEMKKSLIAWGVTALVGSLGSIGVVGMAHAQAVPAATQLKESSDGIGHILLVPYYTVQEGNATLLNIVNTDKTNGKAIKIRFRGASNADDVLSFTVYLSPNDVWAAEVSQNPATGLARLYTPDDSCAPPAAINRDFNPIRVNHVANETREGYVEIQTMADVVPGTDVFTAINHVDGKLPAPCTGNVPVPLVLRSLMSEAGVAAAGFGAPTTGLFANWSIFNVADATSWSGNATAIVAVDNNGTAAAAKMVLHPQYSGLTSEKISDLTTDPLMLSGVQTAQLLDFPDLSTPYVAGVTPAQQVAMLSAALAKSSVRNEYFTDSTVAASTDWVFTLPTRRYSVTMDYAADVRAFAPRSADYFTSANSSIWSVDGIRRICLSGSDKDFWSRSSQQWIDPGLGIEPRSNTFHLCGAVSVWSINAGDTQDNSALAAGVIRTNYELDAADGWGELRTPGISNLGLPVLGAAFAKATSTNIGAGVSGNFGLVWEHRYTRPGGVVH